MNILFVCTGNTCRSPMAAALMNKIAAECEIDVRADSAGIFASDGDMASDNAIKAMIPYGIDLTEHRSKPVTEDLITESDLILAMTAGHKMVLEPMADGKVFSISEYTGGGGDIPDPYGGDLEEYSVCADAIYSALTHAAEKISDEND